MHSKACFFFSSFFVCRSIGYCICPRSIGTSRLACDSHSSLRWSDIAVPVGRQAFSLRKIQFTCIQCDFRIRYDFLRLRNSWSPYVHLLRRTGTYKDVSWPCLTGLNSCCPWITDAAVLLIYITRSAILHIRKAFLYTFAVISVPKSIAGRRNQLESIVVSRRSGH